MPGRRHYTCPHSQPHLASLCQKGNYSQLRLGLSLPVGQLFTAPPCLSLPVGQLFTAPPCLSLPVGQLFSAPPCLSLPVGQLLTAPPCLSLPVRQLRGAARAGVWQRGHQRAVAAGHRASYAALQHAQVCKQCTQRLSLVGNLCFFHINVH